MGDSASLNPCQLVVNQLNRLVTVVKDVDEKVKDLELDVDLNAKYSLRAEDPSEAALQLRDEAKKLLEEARISARDLKESNRNCQAFLEDMVGQLKNLSNECTEMEAYMAQYGYVAPPPPDPAIFNIFTHPSSTPPAAADLLSEEVPVTLPESTEVQSEPAVAEVAAGGREVAKKEDKAEIPSIFDIGLSVETLQMITGLSSVAKTNPVFASAKKVLDSLKKSTVETPQEKLSRVNMENLLEYEKTYEASPILRLFQPARAIDQSTPTSSPPFALKQVALPIRNEAVEISPGLYTRKQTVKPRKIPGSPEMKKHSDGTPMTPVLATVDLQAIIRQHEALRKDSLLQAKVAEEGDILTPEYLVKGLPQKKNTWDEDIDTPELLTMDLKQQLGSKITTTKTPDTPKNTYGKQEEISK